VPEIDVEGESETFVSAETKASGDDLWLGFELPKGSYATTLLRELLKVDVDAPLDDAPSSGP
jgi:tRNA(Glu) U13 pseudouridine synthase TruD